MREVLRSCSAWRKATMLAATVGVLGWTGSSASAALVLRYTFDEASSGTTAALDSSGYGGGVNNGTFTNTATRTSNTPGGASLGAFNDPGTEIASPLARDAVGVATDVLKTPIGTGSFTMCTWLNLRADPSSGDAILTDQGSSYGLGWQIRAVTGSTLTANNFSMWMQDTRTGGVPGKDILSTLGSSPIDADNKWVFVAVTYDSATTALSFYSGTETAAVIGAGTTTLTRDTADLGSGGLKIGASGRASNLEPNAFFDDVRIYNEVLDSTQLEGVRLANVPEPASLGFLGLGLVGLLRRQRRD